MDADLEDFHPSLRAKLLEDNNYLKTQSDSAIEFYRTNGVDAEYSRRKLVLSTPAGYEEDV